MASTSLAFLHSELWLAACERFGLQPAWSFLRLCVLVAITGVLHQSGVAQDERPEFYPATWPQFHITEQEDPRLVSLMRSGSGPDRPAEFTVLEVVDGGAELRIAHKIVLRNQWVPATWDLLGRGRFLVTKDDWDGVGAGANTLVVYDLATSRISAWSLEDMLTAEQIAGLRHNHWPPGVKWLGYEDWLDSANLLLYTASPEEAREEGLPFIEVDLRSAKVSVRPAPARWESEVVTLLPRNAVVNWSLPRTPQDEGSWSVRGHLPQRISFKVTGELQSVQKRLLGLSGDEEAGFFLLDPAEKVYKRVSKERWTKEGGDKK